MIVRRAMMNVRSSSCSSVGIALAFQYANLAFGVWWRLVHIEIITYPMALRECHTTLDMFNEYDSTTVTSQDGSECCEKDPRDVHSNSNKWSIGNLGLCDHHCKRN